jgi:hypothetical protein
MYTPDKWMVVKLESPKGIHYRVFAVWRGGYLHGDSWQLNSGITSVTEDKHYYYFNGQSGSVYQCHKEMYGTSLYGEGVLANMIEQSKDDVKITVLEDQNWMDVNYE